MIKYGLTTGVEGFSFDVITLISKAQRFLNDDGSDTRFVPDGRRFYTDGPRIHEYLKEIHKEAFGENDLLTVGEMSSTSLENCVRYSNPQEKELSMAFSFHHLKVDYPNGEKWVKKYFQNGRLECMKEMDGMQLSGIITISQELYQDLEMTKIFMKNQGKCLQLYFMGFKELRIFIKGKNLE